MGECRFGPKLDLDISSRLDYREKNVQVNTCEVPTQGIAVGHFFVDALGWRLGYNDLDIFFTVVKGKTWTQFELGFLLFGDGLGWKHYSKRSSLCLCLYIRTSPVPLSSWKESATSLG